MKLHRAIDEGRNPGGEQTADSIVDTASFQAFRAELNTVLPSARSAKAPTLDRRAVRPTH
jgi:hypothetical protein